MSSKFSSASLIIYNLAQMHLSIDDAKYIDIDTYIELCQIQISINDNKNKNKKATQSDIDSFIG